MIPELAELLIRERVLFEVIGHRKFAEETEIVFESGTGHEAVNMPIGAYVRVERPAIVPLARAA